MGLRQQRIATTEYILWNGDVEVRCFGRATGDWSLKQTVHEAVRENKTVLERLKHLREHYECGRIVMPNPGLFNAAIVHAQDHNEWNVPWHEDKIVRGPYADAVVFTNAGHSFAIASADCPTVVLYAPDKRIMIVGHAGRDSLFDRDLVLHGKKSRNTASVIDAMMDVLCGSYNASAGTLRAFIACGISGPSFQHHPSNPTYGGINTKILEYFQREAGKDAVAGGSGLSLPSVIRAQLRRREVHVDRIGFDAVDTHANTDAEGNPVWASQRRDGKGRNLVLVTMR